MDILARRQTELFLPSLISLDNECRIACQQSKWFIAIQKYSLSGFIDSGYTFPRSIIIFLVTGAGVEISLNTHRAIQVYHSLNSQDHSF
jgi:hypothetical protein